MAKTLVKALENGIYNGTIIGVSTSAEIGGVRKSFNLLDETEKTTFEELKIPTEFYSLKIQLSDRQITVNKFCNKFIWTDSTGDGWTSADFFLSGIQRQLEIYDTTDDIEIFSRATNVKFWISQYVNPNTGKKSYNVDTAQPKTWISESELGLEF